VIIERFRKTWPKLGAAALGYFVNPKTIRIARKFDLTVEEFRAVRPDLTREQIKTRIRELLVASLEPAEVVLSRLLPDDL